jgi:hypothetical protein
MTTLAEAPNDRLVMYLQVRFDLNTLIETGTFEGTSTVWAAERFREVLTIDIRRDFLDQAQTACSDHQNVLFMVGDTRFWLRNLVPTQEVPVMFWLDAHSAPGMFGDHDDWPVLDELAIITQSPSRHFILIDDAHCFLAGTPFPACPKFDEVFDFATDNGYATRIIGDVIVLVPQASVGALDEFEAAA